MRTRNRHWHALTVRSREPSAHKVAIQRARRHRRGREWPVVTLAPEKPLFLNPPRKRFVVTLCGKSLAISTNASIQNDSGLAQGLPAVLRQV